MAVGVPTYTGLNAGEVLKQSTGERVSQAQTRMSDRILEAEKFKYTEKKREEAEFLKNVYIKPEYLISTKARTEMANSLKGFNERWTGILKDNKGILPFDLKVQMQNEKALLESTQNDLLQQMGQWKMMNDAVLRDNGVNYDKDEWDQITNKFLETGRIDITQPPLKSRSFAAYLAKRSSGFGSEIEGRKPWQSGNQIVTETVNMRPEDVPAFIRTSIMEAPPQEMKDLVLQFQKAPDKFAYLEDTNADGTVNDRDIDDNAIIRWAVANQRFREAAVKKNLTYKNVPRPRVGESKFNKNLPVSATNNRNDEYDLLSEQRIQPAFSKTEKTVSGQTTYINNEVVLPDFVPMDYANKTPIVLPISEVFTFDEAGNKSKKTLSPSHQIPVQVLGFSPTANVLMVQALDDSRGADRIRKDDKIALDASTYDKYLKRDFGIYREGYKKKETSVPTTAPSALSTMSWEEWSMKNPQRTRQEYDLEMGKGAGIWEKNKRK